jgi:hypothetical protein
MRDATHDCSAFAAQRERPIRERQYDAHTPGARHTTISPLTPNRTSCALRTPASYDLARTNGFGDGLSDAHTVAQQFATVKEHTAC